MIAPAALFALRGNRFADRVARALEGAARTLVGGGLCRTVVFGHLHHRADLAVGEGRYLNAGMFFRRGRDGAPAVSWIEEDADGLRLRSAPSAGHARGLRPGIKQML
jgi:hypothetical protein